jgi:2'-5' RNA ligase
MPYSIELNFDKNSNGRIIHVWETLANKSLNSEMVSIGAKPHISLAVLDFISPDELHDDLEIFAKKIRNIPVVFHSVQMFPADEGVMYLAIENSIELNKIHLRLHTLLKEKGYKSNEYYLPGRWIPHCTITMGLTAEKANEVAEICNQMNVFGNAELIEMSLIEFRPVREIYSFSFINK